MNQRWIIIVLLGLCVFAAQPAGSRLVSNLSWIAWAKGTLVADPEIETRLVLETRASFDPRASERAASGFRLAFRLNVRNASAYAGEGMASLARGELLTAKRLFQRALLLDPGNVVWRFWYASLAARLGEDEAAIREWQHINAAPYFAMLGDQLLSRGAWSQAVDLYRRALTIDPTYPDVQPRIHYGLGLAYVNLGRWPEALDALQKSVEVDPTLPDAHCWLAQTYSNLGDRSAAQAAFERCANLGSLWGCLATGGAYLNQGDFATAELWYRRAQRLAPEAAGPYLGLGQIAMARRRFQEAWGFFDQALQKQPNDPGANKEMGLWFFAQRQYEDAAYWLERSVALGNQNDFWVYLSLGDAYTALGRCALALDYYAKAMQASDGEIAQLAAEKTATTQSNCPTDR